MNCKLLYESEIIRLYKFNKELSKGNPSLKGSTFTPTKYFAIYNHPDIPQVVVFPVLMSNQKHKITESDINKLEELSIIDAWQYLMEYYNCECAGALATGNIDYDIDLIKIDKEYLQELWKLNN